MKRLIYCLLLETLLLAGCGYQVRGRETNLAPEIHSLAIPIFANRTDQTGIETDVAQDLADKAESSYTKEFLLSLTDSEREQLLQLDDALKILDKGEFGTCQICGQAISKKRLEALPWAATCISCQQKVEAERA